MIRKIRLRNFQVHKFLEVTFGQVTTFVGCSDAGKSAVLRAIRWVCLNQPNGSEFVTTGKSRTSVELTLDSGHVVTRVRGKGVNAYYLDKKKYVSFGAHVPDSIKHVLSLDDINFQGQIDAPLWFTDTPGQVSKKLNRIVNLDKIDDSLANAAAEVRRANNSYAATKDRHKEAKAERDRLRWVVAARTELKDLDAMKASFDSLTAKVSTLHRLVREIKTLTDKIEFLEQIISDARVITAVGKKAAKKKAQADALKSALTKIKKGKVEPPPDVNALVEIRTKGDRLAEKQRNLEIAIDDLKELEKQICLSKQKLAEAEAGLKKVTKGKCPTCGQKASPKLLGASLSQSRTYTRR